MLNKHVAESSNPGSVHKARTR